jgi:hypothetical protein
MDETFGKIVAALVIVSAVVFDWPRALAGAVVGFGARRLGYVWTMIPAGVVLVAALGEVIYPLIGRSDAMSWNGFTLGLIAAGATAVGLFRVLLDLARDSGSSS